MKFCVTFFLSISILSSYAEDLVDYRSDILPLMKEHCWDCHSNEKQVKGSLAFDDLDEVRESQIGTYNLIRPGNSEESNFVERLLLDSGDTDFMPRKAEKLPKKDIELIQKWIDQGAVVDAKKPTEKEQEWVDKSGGGISSSMPAAPEFQNWTNQAGKTIEAVFVSGTADSVTIKMRNGKQFQIPLNSLSANSAALAAKLTKP
ncbi:hypothetical protein N9B73_00770 [Verrucomicrobiales bacterium]|nr:hypothetical protein [Verrucomicrobiales bacterium]